MITIQILEPQSVSLSPLSGRTRVIFLKYVGSYPFLESFSVAYKVLTPTCGAQARLATKVTCTELPQSHSTCMYEHAVTYPGWTASNPTPTWDIPVNGSLLSELTA